MALIEISDLTNKEPEGGGAFDDLMESAKAHIREEYDSQRINQTDYAKVYLGMLEACMGQALQFVLQKQQADKQAELLSAQIANTEQDTLNKVEQTKLTITQNQLTKQEVINATIQGRVLIGQAEKMEQEVLVAQQQVLNMQQTVLKTIAEVSMLAKQEEKIDADIVLAYQQLQTQAAEIALIHARRDLVAAQVLAETKSLDKIDAEILLLGAQLAQINAEASLLAQREANLAKELLKIEAETALLLQRKETEVMQTALILSQKFKIDKEVELIAEKVITERAQHTGESAFVTDANPGEIGGVIGKQMLLFQRQGDGFLRDAEQKAAKILVDSWNVRKSADPNTTAVNANNLDDGSIAGVVQKLKEGIKAVDIDPPSP